MNEFKSRRSEDVEVMQFLQHVENNYGDEVAALCVAALQTIPEGNQPIFSAILAQSLHVAARNAVGSSAQWCDTL